MMKILVIISILFAIILLVWILGSLYAVKSLEEPKHSVIESKKWYEIRQYESYLVAEVVVIGNQDQALNTGFRYLAGYIFWWNTKKESISMTTPVSDIQSSSEKISMTVPVNDISSGEKHTIQFSLPSTYTLETLPVPNNDKIKLRKVAWYKAAALRYTWWATEEKVTSKKLLLSNLLQSESIETIWDMNSAQYNPPLSFPWIRRNEIIVKIK